MLLFRRLNATAPSPCTWELRMGLGLLCSRELSFAKFALTPRRGSARAGIRPSASRPLQKTALSALYAK